MRSISIYALTRNQNKDSLSKLERQLSGREYFLKIREWELQSMKALVRQLESHMTKVCSLRFFYSYQILQTEKHQNSTRMFLLYMRIMKRRLLPYWKIIYIRAMNMRLLLRDIKRLVIILDERYYYDQNRYLRSKYLNKEGRSDVRNLFHRLN